MIDERIVAFEAADERLLGVLTLPAAPASGTAVVIVVGGPQYRVGSHRQFVQLARALAADGHVALRFDYRGMGDSTGAARPFDQVSADIAAAVAAVRQQRPDTQRVVLWGLCDGAAAALLYCRQCPGDAVDGLCLANPWVRSQASQARTQVKHYYTERLRDPQFWRKLLRGQVALSALVGLWRSVQRALKPDDAPSGAAADASTAPRYQDRMAQGWQAFDGAILLLLSAKDHTAREFADVISTDAAWRGALGRARVRRVDLADADHTFSGRAQRLAAEAATLDWLRTFAGPA
ncbi:MAG: hydrolase 1, exosortase A system-associated [Burkholderiales bacterium]|nr:hydrolase 1, exosortase A system-associated [Burkholderiales bacterium]